MAKTAAVCFWIALLAPSIGRAQPSPPADPVEVPVLIESLGGALRAHYVFRDRVDDIMDHLRARQAAGAYRGASPDALAQALTSDLIDVSDDLHFGVGVDPDWVAAHRDRAARIDEIRREERAEEEAINHGFVRAERLAGNVGYLRLDYFASVEYGTESAAAAMRFVQNSDALILDMRYNRGGHMDMVQFLASYLFSPAEEIRLFDYVFPSEDGSQVERQWVLPYVPGRRMTEIPVTVLTGTSSFSAGEWLAYVLQKLGRATVIGERSAGAAHSTATVPLDDRFFLQVPGSLTRDPVEGADFEGEGVTPDVEVAAHLALDEAHLRLLDALSETDPAVDADWYRPIFQARLTPPADPDAIVERAASRYEGRELIVEDGSLMYHWRGRFSLRLSPLTDTLFAVEGTDDYRFRLVVEDGAVVAIERIFRDGTTSRYARR